MADSTTVDDQLESMRRNLRLAVGRGGGVVADSTALTIAAKLAACVIAEDMRAIRESLIAPATPTEPAQPVRHFETGPGQCNCGFDAYKIHGIMVDYHAETMAHFSRVGVR